MCEGCGCEGYWGDQGGCGEGVEEVESRCWGMRHDSDDDNDGYDGYDGHEGGDGMGVSLMIGF